LNYLFQRENWSVIQTQGASLTKKHYLEIAHYQDIPLDLDHEAYLALERNGNLRVFTARDEDGALVGYAIFFLRMTMHYKSSLQAVQDILYIDKEHRGFGKKFIEWCDCALAGERVQVVYHHVKCAHDFSPMLERLGYQQIDKIFGKRLDEFTSTEGVV
jgi:GNAT superfamily N-acetyltransferase